MKSRYLSMAIAMALTATALGAGPAAAQDAPAGKPESRKAGNLGEVVVTARKREETLQEVPVAVTAFTAETRACGCIGKVTSEISQRSTFSSRRRPVRGSVRARSDRKPIESPSTAPSRIRA